MTFTLYYQLLNHVMEKLTHLQQHGVLHLLYDQHVMFIDLGQFTLSSLDKLSTNLSKDQFRETRKYLQSLYVQQPNQPQTNNMTEGGEEGEAMHVHEDYQNYPYQLQTLTSDHQQQIEERLSFGDTKMSLPIRIYGLL